MRTFRKRAPRTLSPTLRVDFTVHELPTPGQDSKGENRGRVIRIWGSMTTCPQVASLRPIRRKPRSSQGLQDLRRGLPHPTCLGSRPMSRWRPGWRRPLCLPGLRHVCSHGSKTGQPPCRASAPAQLTWTPVAYGQGAPYAAAKAVKSVALTYPSPLPFASGLRAACRSTGPEQLFYPPRGMRYSGRGHGATRGGNRR